MAFPEIDEISGTATEGTHPISWSTSSLPDKLDLTQVTELYMYGDHFREFGGNDGDPVLGMSACSFQAGLKVIQDSLTILGSTNTMIHVRIDGRRILTFAFEPEGPVGILNGAGDSMLTISTTNGDGTIPVVILNVQV